VLPGLLLRALIPIGFMPVFGAHTGVQLSMCDGYAPVAPMPDMPMPAGGKSTHSLCPYGAGPALAALPVLDDAPTFIPVSAPPPVSAAQIGHVARVARTQSPRAPPLNA
jgi:hypothetical protein